MIKRTLGQLAEMVGGRLSDQEEAVQDKLFTGVSTDSRTLQPDMLFVPIQGESFNGHDYAVEAIEKGASAILWQSDHGEPPAGTASVIVEHTLTALQQLAAAYRRQLDVRIVGITGSNGKTTTKDMIAAVLGTAYRVCKTQGNYNNHLGLPLTLLQMSEETEVAVLEMGMSDRGEIALLSEIAAPDAAVITHIGEAHLKQLGSREAIAQAKLEILEGLSPGGIFVYPGDEPLIAQWIERQDARSEYPKLKEMKLIRFGTAESNDLYPIAVMLHSDSVQFAMNTEPSLAYRIPLVGRHNVNNALAAIAIGKCFNIEPEKLRAGLAAMQSSGMRSELIRSASGVAILNDAYNASPSSMGAALALLAEMPGYEQRIAVLGDMLELGERQEAFHTEIGKRLDPEQIDYVLTYGKLAARIAEAAAPLYKAGRVLSFEHQADLIEALKRIAGRNDIVLVKGSRGMRLETIVNALQD